MQSGHLKFFCSQANHYCIISVINSKCISYDLVIENTEMLVSFRRQGF